MKTGIKTVSVDDAAADGRDQMQQSTHERALAGSVFSDDTEVVAGIDSEIESVEDGTAFVTDTEVLNG